jgi:hypothetical protein
MADQDDPYAKIAAPVGDPYASVAKPVAEGGKDKSLWQKAKDNFSAATQGAKPGDGVVKGAVENFGAGAADNLRAIAHPIDTLEGIGHAVVHPIDTAANMVHAAIANPARFAGQIGGGALMGEGAGALADMASPAISNAAGRAALMGRTPEAAYEGALKPSPSISAADRTAAVKTGLEQGIVISKAGLSKLGDQIETLNQAIKDEIAKDPNRPIDPNKVATRADAARARFATQVNAQPDLDAIEASRQQFLNEQGQRPGVPAQPPQPTGVLGPNGQPIMNSGTPAQPPVPAPPMAAADAQAMKQGTYRVLKGKFGEQGSASVEAQKALARGLKEEIASAFPEIGKLNGEESRLLDLQPILERAVNRISNREPISLGGPVVTTAVKAATGSTGAAAALGVMKEVLSIPALRSRLAIAVSRGAKIPYASALAKVGSYAGSIGAIASSPQDSTSGDSPDQSATPQP